VWKGVFGGEGCEEGRVRGWWWEEEERRRGVLGDGIEDVVWRRVS
jgi:hypothetical protein